MFLTNVRNFIRTYFLAVTAAIILLIITLLSFLESYERVQERNKVLFTLRADNAKSAIEKRMQDYIQILRSGQALFAVSDTVTLMEWREFVEVLNVDKNYPGIQGIGFSKALRPADLPFFEQQVRERGFETFEVWPDDPRDTYTTILFLEPFNERNQRAFGFDMFTEPTRRKAMKRARDTGKPALTAMVRLVQETGIEVQNGFLLYLPLYTEGENEQTVAERKSAINGWVYCAFRVNDLMKGILRDRFNDLCIEIYDGPTITEEALLYDSDSLHRNEELNNSSLFEISPVRVAGHTWQLYISAKPGFGYEKDFTWFILVVGIIISSLIFLIIYYLTNIRRSNYLRELITDNATAALIILDKNDYCTFANPAAEKLLGYTHEEISQSTFHQLAHHHYPDGRPYPASECPIIKSLEDTGAIYNLESVLFHRNGSQIDVMINSQPIFQGGMVVSHLLEIRDVGPEKLAERALLQKNRNLQTLNNVGKNLSAELELNKLLQLVTDSCTELTGAEFGAFFYNKHTDDEVDFQLQSLSGVDIKAFDNFPMPRTTGLFAPTFHGEGVIRSDDIAKDVRYGKSTPFYGMPEGHLPVKSYLAVPIISRSGEVLGGLFFGHSKTAVFSESDEDIVKGIAAQAAIAIDNSRLFETISQKNDELLKINNDLDNFVYTASHDLKAPVLNIEGLVYALTAALKRDKPERIDDILDKIQLSIRKFKETIQALTEVAKTNKNLEEELESFDIKELVNDELFSIQEALQKADATVELDIDCVDFRFSRANMQSIIHNLITNAVKYRSPERPPHIQLVCKRTAEGICLKVSDNGLGIDPSFHAKIFTMFSRYHTHVEGTGIGLYLVKRIVENNGGTIAIDSEPGRGTTFTIHLPAL